MRAFRGNRAHKVTVGRGGRGGDSTPHGRQQVTHDNHVGRAGGHGAMCVWGGGGEENKWKDCVAEDHRVLGITGDCSTAALDPTLALGTTRSWTW